MIEKIKKVYYCEFCKKHRLTKNSIITHEEHCTLNPNRKCRMCERQGIPDYEIGDKFTDEILDRMRDTIKCPACMLAIIRKWIKDEKKDSRDFDSTFKFQEEIEKYWEDEQNRDIESTYK